MRLFIFICICLGWVGCKKPEVNVPQVFKPAESLHFSLVKGLLMFDSVPFSGYQFQLYENNDTAFVYGYLNGLQEGVSKQWYQHQKIKEIRFYHKGNKTGMHIGWWENGNARFSYRFENDLYTGNCKEWHNNGLMARNNHYKDGHEEGLQQSWFSDGSVQSNYEVVNGRNYGNTGTKHCKSEKKTNHSGSYSVQ